MVPSQIVKQRLVHIMGYRKALKKVPSASASDELQWQLSLLRQLIIQTLATFQMRLSQWEDVQ